MSRNTIEDIRFVLKNSEDLPEYNQNSTYWGNIIYPIADAIRRTAKTPQEVIALSRSLISRLNERVLHSPLLAEKPLDFGQGGENAYIDIVREMVAELDLPDIGKFHDVDPVVAALTFSLITSGTAGIFKLYFRSELDSTLADHDKPVKVKVDVEGQTQEIELPHVIFAGRYLDRDAKLIGYSKNGRLIVSEKGFRDTFERYLKSNQFQQLEENLEEARQFDPVAKLGVENLSTILVLEGRPGTYASSALGKGRGLMVEVIIRENKLEDVKGVESEKAGLISIMRLLGDEYRFRNSGVYPNLFLIEALSLKIYSDMIRRGLITDPDIAQNINFNMASLTEYLLSHHGGASVMSTYRKNKHGLDQDITDHRQSWLHIADVVIEWAEENGVVYTRPDYNFNDSNALTHMLWEKWDETYNRENLKPKILRPGEVKSPRPPRISFED